MTAMATDTPDGVARREAQHRYGAVFLLVLALLVFEVLAPDADWARAVAVALASAALTVAVATSRARGRVRRLRATVVVGAGVIVVVGIATGVVSLAVAFLIGTALAASIPVTLGGGLLRLIRDEGVTLQAVAGALTIYLLVGLLFASLISFVARVQSGPYFTQAGHASNGDRVYYSFTVLTTTGFGDYTAAKPVGHALAVLEMLTGQLYLVTVIGILVGNFVGRRRR
jgi:Ion channel